MMARSAADRYQIAGEVAEDLGRIIAGGIPAALTAALAGRRKGGGGLVTTRKGMGGSTAATRPIGARGVRTAMEAPVVPGLQTTADTQPLAVVGRLNRWQLLAAASAVVLVASLGSFLLVKLLRDRGKSTAVVEDVPRPSPEEEKLKALREKLKAAQAFAAAHPKSYAEILLLYDKLVKEAAGTEIETTTRQAMAEVQRRQEADLSVERLKVLGEEFEKAKAFEAANPEKLPEVLDRYLKFGSGAHGTEFAAKAKEAAEAAKRRHAARAGELLAALRTRVEKGSAAGSFGAALTLIENFPKGYAPAVEPDLGKLREDTLAAGRARWQQLLEESRKLSAAGNFAEAAAAAARGKPLGLPGLDAEISAALAEVDKARLAAEQAKFAAAEQAYKKLSEDLPKLFAEKRYAEARKRGEKLLGTLTAESEAKLRADLSLISGAEGFLKELRAALGRLKADQVKLNTAMGEGFVQSFEAAGDKIIVKVSVGNSSVLSEVEVAGVDVSDLVRIVTKEAGGELSAKAARGAACLLLSAGKTDGVKELLERARKGGEKVDDLTKRLTAIETLPAPAPAPVTVNP